MRYEVHLEPALPSVAALIDAIYQHMALHAQLQLSRCSAVLIYKMETETALSDPARQQC